VRGQSLLWFLLLPLSEGQAGLLQVSGLPAGSEDDREVEADLGCEPGHWAPCSRSEVRPSTMDRPRQEFEAGLALPYHTDVRNTIMRRRLQDSGGSQPYRMLAIPPGRDVQRTVPHVAGGYNRITRASTLGP